MRILIFIEHDIIFRHFYLSNAFKDIEDNNDVKYIFPNEKSKSPRFNVNPKTYGLDKNSFVYLDENQYRVHYWKKIYRIEIIKKGLFNKLHRNQRKLYLKTFDWRSKILFSLLSLPLVSTFYKKLALNKLLKNPYKKLINLLEIEKPDIIIHPTVLEGLFINDLVFYSKTLKTPLIAIMNSWDNPSTKKSILYNPDWLLVWGKQTQKHAIKYMKMSKENAKIFGSAQFDLYNKKININRRKFCKDLMLENEKYILLYAGSSKMTNEFKHLTYLENLIENNILLNCQIIYRPHPWGRGGYKGERILKTKWKNIVIDPTMIEYLENINNHNYSINMSDYKNTRYILSNVDFVISPLSTIIIESAILGKPSLCFVPKDESKALHLDVTKDANHFEDMYNNDYFLFTKNLKEMKKMINKLINRSQDEKFIADLKKEAEYFVASFNKSFSERLLDFCNKIYDHKK